MINKEHQLLLEMVRTGKYNIIREINLKNTLSSAEIINKTLTQANIHILKDAKNIISYLLPDVKSKLKKQFEFLMYLELKEHYNIKLYLDHIKSLNKYDIIERIKRFFTFFVKKSKVITKALETDYYLYDNSLRVLQNSVILFLHNKNQIDN